MNDSMNVGANPINLPDGQTPRTRSKFNLSYHLYNCERFGEYSSNFVVDCVEGDKFPVRSGGTVQSYTLKAPLMQSISKKKDYYMVPMEAILPMNWDKFYTNPVIGADVPDDCGTGVANFWSMVCLTLIELWNKTSTLLANANATDQDKLNAALRCLVIGEYFYSNGSLIRTLGCSGSRYFYAKNNSNKRVYSYDQFFDAAITSVVNAFPVLYFTDSDGNTKVCINDELNYGYMRKSYACVDIRSLLQYYRDDLTCKVTSFESGHTAIAGTALEPYFKISTSTSDIYNIYFLNKEVNYDIRRLCAYQLVCSHFYSNDHVDYVYSAELYRQTMMYLAYEASAHDRFTVNGLSYYYDALSAHTFTWIMSYLKDHATHIGASGGNLPVRALGYLSNLLSYRRSLRFVDYFTGSRTRPLAVGDVSVNVNNNQVDVVDISRNIQRQRFFNAVNRFGRKFEEYIKGLSGITPAQDYHNPLYLAHTSDSVYGVQIENTGSAQWSQSQSVTSRLTSNGARYQFEFSVDRPCVVIGITYYDIARSYLYNCERQLFHMNRFDMFNPFMQFIGDQAVYFNELGTYRDVQYNGNFGYQLRHMEYKQRPSYAAGGFVENLPGYIFSNDDDNRVNAGSISPDYIRSLNTELDRFYLSLTGYSLGSYFHFIVDNDNYCEPSRPMAYAPTIL